MSLRTFRNGNAMVLCMIVLVVASAMAAALTSISGANLQIANDQRRGNRAFANAESGLETMRYWLSRVRIPSSTPSSQYLTEVIARVRADLAASAATNLVINNDGSIPPVPLDSATGQFFQGQWTVLAGTPPVLKVVAMGTSGAASRSILTHFLIEPYRFPIFNYGIATKGAIRFPRNPTLTGAAQYWEADIYVESLSNLVAIQVGGNANFDGDIDIGNPSANVDFRGDVRIADDTGQAAVDEHVAIGADPVEFPVPELTQFRQYATGPAIGPASNVSLSMTLTNATIRAGTNPTFLGNVIIQGILFVESPNVVTFTRNVALEGLIVAEGNVLNPGTNKISFQGNFASGAYPAGSQFDAIRSRTGSSILAPGFGVSFTGNFSSVNGVLAANDLYFSGNASAVVKGTVISYSQNPTMVDGNIAMNFDRAAVTEIPAGFDLLRTLEYDPASYAMAF
ncbi:MAG: hypothetical protein ACM3VT_17050 [Solirubrobacterales bacterium]